LALFGARTDGTYFSGPLTPSQRRQALDEIVAARVRSVVVGPSSVFTTQVPLITSLLGRPPDLVEGGVDVWLLDASRPVSSAARVAG
jgi:hypothetical protein